MESGGCVAAYIEAGKYANLHIIKRQYVANARKVPYRKYHFPLEAAETFIRVFDCVSFCRVIECLFQHCQILRGDPCKRDVQWEIKDIFFSILFRLDSEDAASLMVGLGEFNQLPNV